MSKSEADPAGQAGSAAGFVRSVLIVAGGTAAAQLIAVAASPILSRVYSPKDYGVFGVYTSLVAIAAVASSLSYHQAIPLPEREHDAGCIVKLALRLVLAAAMGVGVTMWLAGGGLVETLGMPDLRRYLWLMPFGVLAAGTFEILTQWTIRRRRFSDITRAAVCQSVGQSGTQVAAGLIAASPLGLLAGQVVGQATSVAMLISRLTAEDRQYLKTRTHGEIAEAARRYRSFALYGTPASLMNAVGANAPSLVLSALFGGAVTGMFILASRVLLMPVTLLSKSSAQVFLSRAATALRAGTLPDETRALFERLSALAVPYGILGGAAAPAAFALAFWRPWREAGVYAQWLCPWLVLVFISGALSPLVAVYERQAANMTFQTSLFVGRLGALALGGVVGEARWAIGLYAIASAGMWLAFTVWLLRLSGNRVAFGVSHLGWQAAVGTLAAAPTILARLSVASDVTVTVTAAISGAAMTAWLYRKKVMIWTAV